MDPVRWDPRKISRRIRTHLDDRPGRGPKRWLKLDHHEIAAALGLEAQGCKGGEEAVRTDHVEPYSTGVAPVKKDRYRPPGTSSTMS